MYVQLDLYRLSYLVDLDHLVHREKVGRPAGS